LEDSNNQTKQIVLSFATFIWAAFLFNGINLVISAYFTAIHKPLHSIIIAISRSFILPIFFIFTLPFLFNINGIFLAIPMAEFITFVIAIILFKKFSPERIIYKDKVNNS
jgi:Na+-driven multidrug efflux pump